jgi:hypothetical protein
VPDLAELLEDYPPIDRTTTNAWEDAEFLAAVRAAGRRKLIVCALWTEICIAFPALDALREAVIVIIPWLMATSGAYGSLVCSGICVLSTGTCERNILDHKQSWKPTPRKERGSHESKEQALWRFHVSRDP